MTKRLHLLTAVSALTVLASPAFSATQTFDTPLTLSPTQAAGTWYTDRYAPAGFQSQATDPLGNTNVLHHRIDAADGASNRPGAYSSSFYNTQGRSFDMEAGTQTASIDLFISGKWASVGRRMASFWGVGRDAGNAVSAYPIIAFNSNGTDGFFEIYNSNTGVFTNLGLPSGFSYDAYTTLSISLAGPNLVYKIGNLTGSYDANGTTSLGSVLLQGHNTQAGDTYSIYWDNLNSAVTEPATWAMMIGGFALAGAAMRRKKAVVAFA